MHSWQILKNIFFEGVVFGSFIYPRTRTEKLTGNSVCLGRGLAGAQGVGRILSFPPAYGETRACQVCLLGLSCAGREAVGPGARAPAPSWLSVWALLPTLTWAWSTRPGCLQAPLLPGWEWLSPALWAWSAPPAGLQPTLRHAAPLRRARPRLLFPGLCQSCWLSATPLPWPAFPLKSTSAILPPLYFLVSLVKCANSLLAHGCLQYFKFFIDILEVTPGRWR